MIPYGRQDIRQSDVDTVVDILRSDFLTQGPRVPEFEKAVAKKVGAKHAVAVNSATSALHIACLAVGLGPGDWAWTSPITFVASANAALYCGAKVDFVDIDPESFNISPARLAEKLEAAERAGNLPKVLIAVHMCGQPCDMEEIATLARRYGVRIIEDGAHAIGASYRGAPVGNCRYSDITVFSFHPVKIITTAEGGLAMTNDADLAARMELLRSHGITRDPNQMTHAPDGPWYYQQIDLGFNYRMTELQAALGLSQLTRLEEYVTRRNQLADIYDVRLSGLPLDLPVQSPNVVSARHLYVIRLRTAEIHRSHADVFAALRKAGIGVNLHYIPVHLQPWYGRMGFGPGDYPAAEDYYARAISIPLYPGLHAKDQDAVITALESVLSNA